MLVLTRKVGQEIKIRDDITVRVTRIHGGAVQLAIGAPKNVVIWRGELYPKKKK